MAFSTSIHRDDGGTYVHMSLAGDVVGHDSESLRRLISQTIHRVRPLTLVIDIRDVAVIDDPGMIALIDGYTTAIDYGTSFRVTHARGRASDTLSATGVLEMLKNSDDIGALILAVHFSDTRPGLVSGNDG